MDTVYQVKKNGKVVCCGNMKQCLLFLFNTEDTDRTVQEVMLEDTCIEPVPAGSK